MNGLIKTGTNYHNTSVCCRLSDGTPTDPSVISMGIYSVSQVDGSLSLLYTRTPVKQNSKTGWYGYSEDISGYAAGQYVCLVEATVDSIDCSWTDSFFVNAELKTVSDNLDQALSTTESNIRGEDSDDLTGISDEIDAIGVIGAAIQGKTDNLPADPASQSDVETAISTSESNIRGTESLDLTELDEGLVAVIEGMLKDIGWLKTVVGQGG